MATAAIALCFLPEYWSDDGFVMICNGLGGLDISPPASACTVPPGAIQLGYGWAVPHAVTPSRTGAALLVLAAVLCLAAAWALIRSRHAVAVMATALAGLTALLAEGFGSEVNPVEKFALGGPVLLGFLVAAVAVMVWCVVLGIRQRPVLAAAPQQ